MGIYSITAVVLVFLVLVLESQRFRSAANEFFGHYCTSLLRYGWPYFLIYVAYNLIENHDLAATARETAVRWPYLAEMIIGGVGLYLLLMILSERIRSVGNELWGHYAVNSLRLGWPYVLIIAGYVVLTDGSLAAFVKRTLALG